MHVRRGRPTHKLTNPGRRSQRKLRLALLPLLAVSLIAALAACQPTRPVDKSKPIVLVHGYNFSPASVDCGGTFDTLISSLKAQGFTGPFIRVGYYNDDTNCDVNLHKFKSFDDRDSFKTIGQAFSAFVQQTYTSKGITIDAVGYSMGALVVRAGIDGAEHGASGFGAPIDVEDFVSLGGPHAGAAWYTRLCFWGQCEAMKPGSDDLNWLNQDTNPQGKNGTDSTVIGSDADTTVPAVSATYMSVLPGSRVVYSDVPHSGSNNYTHNAAVMARTGDSLAKPGY